MRETRYEILRYVHGIVTPTAHGIPSSVVHINRIDKIEYKYFIQKRLRIRNNCDYRPTTTDIDELTIGSAD